MVNRAQRDFDDLRNGLKFCNPIEMAANYYSDNQENKFKYLGENKQQKHREKSLKVTVDHS